MADRLRVAAKGVSFSSQIDIFFPQTQTQLKRLFQWEYTERCDTYKSRLWSQPIGQQLPLAPVRSLNSAGMDIYTQLKVPSHSWGVPTKMTSWSHSHIKLVVVFCIIVFLTAS